MSKRLIYSFAVTLLATASAYAGQEIRAVISFSFHVGESLLPSGPYTADMNTVTGGVIALRSADFISANKRVTCPREFAMAVLSPGLAVQTAALNISTRISENWQLFHLPFAFRPGEWR